MSAFASLIRNNAKPDEETLRSLSLAMASFGKSVLHSNTANHFQVLRTAASVEREPEFVADENGVSAVGNIRWTAREELVRTLNASSAMTDAALLLLAYRRWGTDLLLHVQGEFAFVLWDSEQHIALAATDHFGIRPLFYSAATQGLLLSDSVPVLRDSKLCDIAMDENSIADFLSIGFIIDERATYYRGIQRLAPATRLIYKDGHIQVAAYWQPPAQEELLLLPRIEDYAEQLRHLLLQVVAERIPLAGAIGVMLSGGMDSTSIAACICHVLGRESAADRVTAYTHVSRIVREREGHYAASVTKHLGIRHQVFVSEDAIEESLQRHMAVRPPQPSLEPPSLATSLPGLEMATQGGTLFSGQGGDAQFRPTRCDLQRIAATGLLRTPLQCIRYWKTLGTIPAFGWRPYLAQKLGKRGVHLLPVWIHPSFAQRTGLQDRLDKYLATRTADVNELRGPFWTNLLGLGVSSLTGASFDVSYPYFDIRLMRFSSCLPDDLLWHKRILREAMRTLLPDDVLQRPKTPLGSTKVLLQIDPHHQQRRSALLDETGSSITHIVNLDVVRRSIASPEAETSLGLGRIELLLRWIARSA
ncbi:asparagine synthetase B [Terriglobus sp. RCC_193]|uniref:asparagine synthetase B family protein n=1 Tax=Terriglobus sp. RCC_193 TaxID=3239218 RepID=UPI0035238825